MLVVSGLYVAIVAIWKIYSEARFVRSGSEMTSGRGKKGPTGGVLGHRD